MKRNTITDAEWQVLEALWVSPSSLMELAHLFEARPSHWSKSTVATMLRRMEEKGLVGHRVVDKTKIFYGEIGRDEAVRMEAHSLLDKVFSGSVIAMVNTMVHHETLTKEELDDLYNVLRQAENGQSFL